MAAQEQYEELARQLNTVNAVKRDLARALPADCPPAAAAVLLALARGGEMRMSRLAELLAVDMSVTSRHVAHVADRGWIERLPDPADKRSRLLRLTAAGAGKLDELSERTAERLAEQLGDWSDTEVGELIRLMTKLRASFGDCRTPARARPLTPGPRESGRPRHSGPEPPTLDPPSPAGDRAAGSPA
ncbi:MULTISPECIES: MarR family winged helix-turn-helix transcriptional regulator [Streptomyces]|uniref:MarR transcriptional regulatory protein n=1 Tax=Streptomyces albus (strain ATCC 21838 / DSM 41398 / FERM P-419 / JCM 4703 / NBRC 107858) TaxID=1081613 RepID=A0A0B5EY48_STRA4|nr:MarR family winged helix-turn-helix transcriptional regulator [Streptomyces sp. SCSIO ZS0520]AJE84195.1 marR transcriptional regulatory protein [Streptomyces albus]AOU78502.1 marR transcriptional regulatory protein [Streptomyces albus]AYN34247.1 MarR family transcriptional regulator [Streptomyces albus]